MRAFIGNVGFAMAVLYAVAVATLFAFVLGASFEIVFIMLALGLFTAIAEHVMRLRQNETASRARKSDG